MADALSAWPAAQPLQGQCGGSGLCKHGRQRSDCKDCGGQVTFLLGNAGAPAPERLEGCSRSRVANKARRARAPSRRRRRRHNDDQRHHHHHRRRRRRRRRMEVLVLGAGHDVGRSCVVVTLGDKRIMFDCGMHIGYKDSRRFPDFTKLTPHGGSLTSVIDAVVITHFHLDHCGALPHMTEVLGYDGPIYMTAPTAAICPSLLEDFRHLMTDRRGEPNLYTSEDITACMRKVTNPTLALALALALT